MQMFQSTSNLSEDLPKVPHFGPRIRLLNDVFQWASIELSGDKPELRHAVNKDCW